MDDIKIYEQKCEEMDDIINSAESAIQNWLFLKDLPEGWEAVSESYGWDIYNNMGLTIRISIEEIY